MKKRKFYLIISAAIFAAVTAVSCAGINSLSNDEAEALGYGVGKIARHYINN